MRTSLLFMPLSLSIACAPVEDLAPDEPSVDAIAGGVRDRGRHPAVVALLLDGGGLCSGTLVGPRAVLTARHCVSETASQVRCPSRRAQVLRDLDPRGIAITHADDARVSAGEARGVDLVVPDTSVLCEADVAVLLIDRAIPGVTPMRLGGSDDPAAGTRVTVVGYGRRGDTRRAGAGERFFRARVPVLGGALAEFSTATSGCEGDSGGPALAPESDRVLGVLSRGGEACNTPSSRLVFTRASVAARLLSEARRRPAW